MIERYADLGLGLVDASIVAIAELRGITILATLNNRDFRVVRPRIDAFTLIPEPRRGLEGRSSASAASARHTNEAEHDRMPAPLSVSGGRGRSVGAVFELVESNH